VVETKPNENKADGREFEEEEEEEEETEAPDPANPVAVAAWIETLRQKGLAKEARRKAYYARVEKDKLKKLTSISGSRPPASPRMGSQSHSSKKKKRKH
jgi:hypothetical protein